MDLGIAGRRALVTGTGRGIGRGIAKVLAKEGAKVAAVSRNQKHLNEILDEIGGRKAGHYIIASDLLEEGAPEAVMKELNEHFGKIDILVNNLGGTLDVTDPFCSLDDWRRIYRMNLEVGVEFTNLVISYMKARNWGRIYLQRLVWKTTVR
jgi:NAD(P)-dependent dehydrogenase (short-subunit alcohol dehydrogenase family)